MAVRRTWLAIAGAFAVSAFLLLRMIDLRAVNLLFYDQIDFLNGLMNHVSPWRMFEWQHGRHRMGVGYWVIAAIYELTGWDTRAEAFVYAGLSCAAVALALGLKKRATGTLTWTDLVIPVLVLSRTQFELFLGTPNAGHGPLSLIFALIAPFIWEIRNPVLRILSGFVLAVCCAFTAYCIVFVPVLAVMFLLERSVLGATACAAAIALFLHGYVSITDAACFQFPDPHPLSYFPFAGFVLMRPSGTGHLFRGGIAVASIFCIVALAFVAFAMIRAVLRRNLLWRAAFVMGGCAVAFALNSAVGRVCLGMENAFASRYTAYVLPLWLAAYFVLAAYADKYVRLRPWVAAAVVAVTIGQWSFSNHQPMMMWFSEGKSRWKSCYLAKRDVRACNEETGFRIYPVDDAPQVEAMLDYLARHKLNLFKP